MSTYSTPAQIDAFVENLGVNPMAVCDMDGNVMIGFTFTGDTPCRLGPQDDPQVQSIPFGTSQRAIAAMVADGTYTRTIFADKAMDVRLAPELVSLLNAELEKNNPFALAFLTSRSFDDAVTLLKESGVRHIERLALVADSGATLQLNGERVSVRPLSEEERTYINGLNQLAPAWQAEIEQIVEAQGFTGITCPALRVEHKAIASNIHYREILTVTGQDEGSALDVAIARHLKSRMQYYVAEGPVEDDGKLTFKTLDGPATVEMKLASIHKGHGLEALIRAAQASVTPPSAVVFTGDDVAKGNGTPGTDYFAMAEADRLAVEYGVPVYTVHTQHPVGTRFDGTEPDQDKSAARLQSMYPQPRIDLTVPHPEAMARVVLRMHGRDTQPVPAIPTGPAEGQTSGLILAPASP